LRNEREKRKKKRRNEVEREEGVMRMY